MELWGGRFVMCRYAGCHTHLAQRWGLGSHPVLALKQQSVSDSPEAARALC